MGSAARRANEALANDCGNHGRRVDSGAFGAGAVTYRNSNTLADTGLALARSKDRSVALERTLTLLRDAETGSGAFCSPNAKTTCSPIRRR